MEKLIILVFCSFFSASISNSISTNYLNQNFISDMSSVFLEYPGYSIGACFFNSNENNNHCYILKNGIKAGEAEFDENGLIKLDFYKKPIMDNNANCKRKEKKIPLQSIKKANPPDGFIDTSVFEIIGTSLTYNTAYGSSWGTIPNVPEYYQDYYQEDYNKTDAYCGPTSILEYLSFYDRYCPDLANLYNGLLPLNHSQNRSLINSKIDDISNKVMIKDPISGEITTTYAGIQRGMATNIMKAGISNIRTTFTCNMSAISWILSTGNVGIVHEGPDLLHGHYMLCFGYHTNQRGVNFLECKSSYSNKPGITMARMDPISQSSTSEDPSPVNWSVLRFMFSTYN